MTILIFVLRIIIINQRKLIYLIIKVFNKLCTYNIFLIFLLGNYIIYIKYNYICLLIYNTSKKWEILKFVILFCFKITSKMVFYICLI